MRRPRDSRAGRLAALSSAIAIVWSCGLEGAGDNPPASESAATAEWLTEAQILEVPDAALGDIYGGAVGLSGKYAFVAAEWDDDDGKDSGAVWVFRDEDEGWKRTQKLRAPDAEAGDNFGRSIAMDGEVAVIGTHWDDSPGHENAGSAYVFRLSEGRWALEQKLEAGDPGTWASMGNAVAVEGPWIAVAAWRKGAKGVREAGAVYLFHFDGQRWSQTEILRARDAGAEDQFGRSVWISGDAMVIGAWGDDARGRDAGAAYFFRRRDGRWHQEQKLTPKDVRPGDRFGFSASLDDGVALVGSHLSSAGAQVSGAAYVFRYDGKRWAEEQKLVSNSPSELESMGMAVALQGDLALVSAHCTFRKVETKPGRAYLFRQVEGQWVLDRRLKPSDGHPGDVFSFHVALDGTTVVAGSWRHSHAGRNSGRAYVFEGL